MPSSLAEPFALILAEADDLAAHPLSARQARLVMTLLDKFADRAFFAWRNETPDRLDGAEDVIAWRAALRRRSPALAEIFDLCALPPAGTMLETQAIKVPFSEYGQLNTADFMVSIYNGNTVQRVLLVRPDGTSRPARDVIDEARRWWQASGLID